jgi:hypothetical protein
MENGVFSVRFKKTEFIQQKIKHGNSYLAANVTAHARVVLITRLLQLSNNCFYRFPVAYCDTDSIVSIYEQGTFQVEQGLGKFIDEEPNEVFEQCYFLAPKSYLFYYQDQKKNPTMKLKGFGLSLANQKKIHQEKIHKMVFSIFFQDPEEHVMIDQFRIQVNSQKKKISYGILCSLWMQKKIGVVYTKRCIIPYYITYPQFKNRIMEMCEQIYTFPYGHMALETQESMMNMSRYLYADLYTLEIEWYEESLL